MYLSLINGCFRFAKQGSLGWESTPWEFLGALSPRCAHPLTKTAALSILHCSPSIVSVGFRACVDNKYPTDHTSIGGIHQLVPARPGNRALRKQRVKNSIDSSASQINLPCVSYMCCMPARIRAVHSAC